MLFASYGCETIVDVDLPENRPVLVANSLFNPDSVWQVRLYKSKSSLDRDPIEAVSNASVRIMDGENLVALLTHVGGAMYRARTNKTPRPGGTYTLKATAPGFDPIEASDFVPVPVPIQSVDVDITSSPFKLTFHFSDPPEIKNYYQVLVLSPVAMGSKRLLPVWMESDDLIFQELGDVDMDAALFDDSLISGKNYSLKLRAYPFGTDPMRQMYVVLLSVTESYYKYMKATEFQENNEDNPFATPIQVYNNIENGLGIFAGFSISKYPLFDQ